MATPGANEHVLGTILLALVGGAVSSARRDSYQVRERIAGTKRFSFRAPALHLVCAAACTAGERAARASRSGVMRKSAYDPVTLRVTWNGEEPCLVGDELVTRTGRRYMVLQMTGKTFRCMVLPAGSPISGRQWCLTWNKRERK